ncbi:hypothetical protein [Aquitalea pelogenes]|uniref:hypothetical protein n=1 Tax=Aquitalea pelogenes TaxID=1293573 RepID=UPI001EFBF3E4|nr:hypothetical protein [Aquitalea pelogenes]
MTKRMFIMLGGIVLLVVVLGLGFFMHIRSLMAAHPSRRRRLSAPSSRTPANGNRNSNPSARSAPNMAWISVAK